MVYKHQMMYIRLRFCVLLKAYFCPNIYLDPFALDGSSGGNEGLSSTTLLLTMFLILIIGVLFQMHRNTKKIGEDTVDCQPLNRDRNDRNFDPPPID